MSQKILITGGAGFIGSNFAHYVAKQRYYDQIIVLDKLTYAGNLENIQTLIDSKSIAFFKGDVSDKKFVFELFEKEKFLSKVVGKKLINSFQNHYILVFV